MSKASEFIKSVVIEEKALDYMSLVDDYVSDPKKPVVRNFEDKFRALFISKLWKLESLHGRKITNLKKGVVGSFTFDKFIDPDRVSFETESGMLEFFNTGLKNIEVDKKAVLLGDRWAMVFKKGK